MTLFPVIPIRYVKGQDELTVKEVDAMSKGVPCTCGHLLDEHTNLYDLYSECQARDCACKEFVCAECREVAGLHCRQCHHTPRHRWDKPSRS
jgi:hypothetical protein